MSKVLAEISASIRRIAGEHPLVIMSGKVVAVDEGEGSCEVCLTVDGPDATREGITINAVTENSNGVLVIPKVGSHVWVAEIDGPGKMGIIKTSDVSKVVVTMNNTPEVVIEPGKVIMNGGDNGGVPINGKVEDNLKALKDYIKNTLEPAIKAAFTAVGAGTTAAGSAGAESFDLAVTPAVINLVNMENESVQH